MKHIIRTRSWKAVGLGRRAVGASLLASGLLLVSPALAGAQTDESTTSTTEVEDTTSTTTTTEVDDTTSTTTTTTTTEVPGATTTTLPAEPVAENITMVFTPDETPDPGCLVGLPRETVYIESTPEIFALKIVANAPLCNPIAAKAAIYGMPGNGEAWPQTLVETLPFTIQEAGTYEVTFTKTCDPVQFDVLSGATPEVIQPLGEWHGPLLYPLDVQTSQQHFGCAEPDVQAATTIAPEVGGIAEVSPAELALTGNSTSTVATTAGAALLLAGAMLLLAYRRRTS